VTLFEKIDVALKRRAMMSTKLYDLCFYCTSSIYDTARWEKFHVRSKTI